MILEVGLPAPRPADIIMLGDSKTNGAWDGDIDPSEVNQWRSSRHHGRTTLMFCDGHAESARRLEAIDPANDYWVRRWNNDNQNNVTHNDNQNNVTQYAYTGPPRSAPSLMRFDFSRSLFVF